MKNKSTKIGRQVWMVTLLHSPEDVEAVSDLYKLNPVWRSFLKDKFGGDVPKLLGICFWTARWIIIVRTRDAGATLAHEIGHALAWQREHDKSEQAAHRYAKRKYPWYVRFYTPKGERIPYNKVD